MSATCVKIIFKIYQSCMDVRKQYALGSVEQKETNAKNWIRSSRNSTQIGQTSIKTLSYIVVSIE